ncbi:hypothetical protein AB4Z38_23865 [Arthrobacter sp. 2RAF6]
MTAAVALGLLAANIPGTAAWAAGRARPVLDFAGKHHMRAGIVLRGPGFLIALSGWGAAFLMIR